MKNLNSTNFPILPICPALLTTNLIDLVNMIQIEDLQFYIFVNRLYLDKKSTEKKIEYSDMRGFTVKFTLNFNYKNLIICSKIKRKDEILKFTFKFLRKKILWNHEKVNKKNIKTQVSLKEVFNSEILKDDKELINRFYSYDVSKKDLNYLKNNELISNKLKIYFYENYMKDMINHIISFKQDEMLKNKFFTAKEFIETLYASQQKKSITLQDGMNTFKIFKNYFCE